VFRSHIDGSLLELSPEKAVRMPGGPRLRHRHVSRMNARRATALRYSSSGPSSAQFSGRSAAARHTPRPDQALFAIVQGGTNVELRGRCAEALRAMDFAGYALGGFSVGEPTEQMLTALAPRRRACCRRTGRAI